MSLTDQSKIGWGNKVSIYLARNGWGLGKNVTGLACLSGVVGSLKPRKIVPQHTSYSQTIMHEKSGGGVLNDLNLNPVGFTF